MNNISKTLLAIGIAMQSGAYANYCLQGGGVAVYIGKYIGKDKKGRSIVKEGVNCHAILSNEDMRPIPCPPQKKK